METRQLVVVAALTKDCCKSAIADEAGGSNAEGSRRTYELHPAICVENPEGQGKHVARHPYQTLRIPLASISSTTKFAYRTKRTALLGVKEPPSFSNYHFSYINP